MTDRLDDFRAQLTVAAQRQCSVRRRRGRRIAVVTTTGVFFTGAVAAASTGVLDPFSIVTQSSDTASRGDARPDPAKTRIELRSPEGAEDRWKAVAMFARDGTISSAAATDVVPTPSVGGATPFTIAFGLAEGDFGASVTLTRLSKNDPSRFLVSGLVADGYRDLRIVGPNGLQQAITPEGQMLRAPVRIDPEAIANPQAKAVAAKLPSVLTLRLYAAEVSLSDSDDASVSLTAVSPSGELQRMPLRVPKAP